MELDDAAVTVPGEAVGRDYRFRADLEIRAGPNDPGLDGAGGLISRRPADRGGEGYFHQRDQLIERGTKPHVLHTASARGASPDGWSGRRDDRFRSNKGMSVEACLIDEHALCSV